MRTLSPDHSVSDILVTILATVTFIEASAFLLLYIAFFKWRKTPAGRAVAGVITAFIAISLASFLFAVFGPDYWARDLLRPLVWLDAAGSFFMLLLALVLAWLRGESAPVLEPKTSSEGSPDRPTPPYSGSLPE